MAHKRVRCRWCDASADGASPLPCPCATADACSLCPSRLLNRGGGSSQPAQRHVSSCLCRSRDLQPPSGLLAARRHASTLAWVLVLERWSPQLPISSIAAAIGGLAGAPSEASGNISASTTSHGAHVPPPNLAGSNRAAATSNLAGSSPPMSSSTSASSGPGRTHVDVSGGGRGAPLDGTRARGELPRTSWLVSTYTAPERLTLRAWALDGLAVPGGESMLL